MKQRKAIRLVKNCFEKSVRVTQMLQEAEWESFKERRFNQRLNLRFVEYLADIMHPPCYLGRFDTAKRSREIDVRNKSIPLIFFRERYAKCID